MIFSLQNISFSYSSEPFIQDLNLDTDSGFTTVLIGPSGCGKTTLLKLMNGLLIPSTGTVAFDGQTLAETNVMEYRLRMGYVIQEGGLFPHLTVYKNVSLMAHYLKGDSIDRRFRELAELVHLAPDLADRYPGELSGGQRQRVGLMRALMLDPDVLLMDEPLGSLDAMIRHRLQQDLKDIFSALKKTVILVTHDLSEARYFADQVVLLNQGAIAQQGTFQRISDQPENEFVSAFINAQTSN